MLSTAVLAVVPMYSHKITLPTREATNAQCHVICTPPGSFACIFSKVRCLEDNVTLNIHRQHDPESLKTLNQCIGQVPAMDLFLPYIRISSQPFLEQYANIFRGTVIPG